VIFEKAKLEGKKYGEIAEELGISIKTVENQMGKALQIMRVQLKDYLVIMLVLWMYKN
jgi:RNA polymerase sigma-70 factor (ECF subfamily)